MYNLPTKQIVQIFETGKMVNWFMYRSLKLAKWLTGSLHNSFYGIP